MDADSHTIEAVKAAPPYRLGGWKRVPILHGSATGLREMSKVSAESCLSIAAAHKAAYLRLYPSFLVATSDFKGAKGAK
jgi:hypothetical protein